MYDGSSVVRGLQDVEETVFIYLLSRPGDVQETHQRERDELFTDVLS